MAKLFDGVRYALSNTLSDEERHEFSGLLDANGATPTIPSHPKLTHYITDTVPSNQPIDDLPEGSQAQVVTPLWVERSIILAARQDESGYSPDPVLIFSGVVATACDLSTEDLDVLSAAIAALGGQWRSALTKEVTHLFALTTGSAKYETALQFKDPMGLKVIVPHWFDDCVRFGQTMDTAPYEWPEPKVFEAHWGKENDTDRSKSRSPQKLSPEKDAVYASVLKGGPVPEPKEVWKGLKLMIAVPMNESQRSAHEADITREGGVVVRSVEEADIVIIGYRSGPDFVKVRGRSVWHSFVAKIFRRRTGLTRRLALCHGFGSFVQLASSRDQPTNSSTTPYHIDPSTDFPTIESLLRTTRGKTASI